MHNIIWRFVWFVIFAGFCRNFYYNVYLLNKKNNNYGKRY